MHGELSQALPHHSVGSFATRNELHYYEPGYLFPPTVHLDLCILLDDNHATGLGVMVSYQCVEIDTAADPLSVFRPISLTLQ